MANKAKKVIKKTVKAAKPVTKSMKRTDLIAQAQRPASTAKFKPGKAL